jgi:hypothetical protein
VHRLILTLIALPCISPDLCVRLREARAAWLRRWEAVEVTRAATASASMDAAAAKACGGVSSGGVAAIAAEREGGGAALRADARSACGITARAHARAPEAVPERPSGAQRDGGGAGAFGREADMRAAAGCQRLLHE